MLSGDIEVNPGPAKSKSKKSERKITDVISTPGSSEDEGKSSLTLADIMMELRGFKKELKVQISALDDVVRKLADEMRALKSGVDDNRQKINELIEQNKQLSDKIDTMENAGDKMKAHMLRNNLIFHGIPQSGLETWEQMEELLCGFITDKLDIDGSQIEFQIVHRLTYARSRPQPIIGKFLRYKQRDEVLRAAVK
uniref:Uncharacterized protein LOC102806060 n=1 Tax=Saccoglossus kowalevskii TaxID=10224 RepID=A0ABM0MMS1_SACKO|nr:PREDICTED: uncharacterized protein LOC102806060 [Saccoglossus kowalevskii]